MKLPFRGHPFGGGLVLPPLSFALSAAACVEEEQPALLLPHGIEVAWEDAYNQEGDGLGALVPVDAMVYDGATGEALGNMPLIVWTDHEGAWPVPGEGVLLVDPDVETAFWDASSDQFVRLELGDDPLSLVTDATGLARGYLYVDSFGLDQPYEPFEVFVSLDCVAIDTAETIVLHPW
jgi:hypothetical protein